MDIITRTVAPLFKARLRDIERYSGRADEIQNRQLRRLLDAAKDTEWGKFYGYRDGFDYEEYRSRVPVSPYEPFYPHIKRMINGESDVLWRGKVGWFAKSSGTTNDRSKYIPVTREILHKCHYKGAFDTVALYLRNYPDTRFFSKKGLILGGSHAPSPLNACSRCGDLSAVLLQNLNPFVNLVRVPCKKIILMDEWEAKVKAIAESTWNKDVVSLSGVPSWMLTVIKAVMERAGKETLGEVWNNLEVFFHGGVGFEPYRAQYQRLISSERMRYMETYNASEGFFGLQDDPSDTGLLLMLDYGVFYEFVPADELPLSDNPHAIPLTEVRTGVNYALVVSSCGGLWRYLIGDTIRFTSVNPYKFVITGRTKLYINAFGEELMVDNAEKSIAEACKATGAAVRAYTAAPLFMPETGQGRHQWLIEFEKQPSDVEEFTNVLDDALKQRNSDYEAKRYKDLSLQKPEVIVAREGLFFEWLKKQGKLGGQHKIPALQNERTLIEELFLQN